MLASRPLPPVRVPVTVVDGSGAGTSERSVTGIEVTRVNAGTLAAVLRTMIEPDWSPGCAGVDAVNRTMVEAPGASVTVFAVRLPNGCQVAVLAWNCAGTGAPVPAVAISAVHVPGAGLATCALP